MRFQSFSKKGRNRYTSDYCCTQTVLLWYSQSAIMWSDSVFYSLQPHEAYRCVHRCLSEGLLTAESFFSFSFAIADWVETSVSTTRWSSKIHVMIHHDDIAEMFRSFQLAHLQALPTCLLTWINVRVRRSRSYSHNWWSTHATTPFSAFSLVPTCFFSFCVFKVSQNRCEGIVVRFQLQRPLVIMLEVVLWSLILKPSNRLNFFRKRDV